MNFIKAWWQNRQRKKLLKDAPKTLYEAILKLDDLMTDEARVRFAKESGTSPGSKFHFGGGMAMRNNWGLWDKEQPLTTWFRNNGIWHADDMSSLIYKAYWCFLNDMRFDIDNEVYFYESYWKMTGVGFDGVKLENGDSELK